MILRRLLFIIVVIEVFREFDDSVFEGLSFDYSSKDARINHATVLLAWYCVLPKATKRVLELGTGSGAISIYLARKYDVEITAIDVDEELIEIAHKNARVNNVTDKVKFMQLSSAMAVEKFSAGSFDVVVSNPPHFAHEGIESPSQRRNSSRRLTIEGIKEFAQATGRLLKSRGAFFFILHPRDLTRWLSAFEMNNLGVHRLRFVFGTANKQSQLVLVKGRKNSTSEVVVEPPIILRKGRS